MGPTERGVESGDSKPRGIWRILVFIDDKLLIAKMWYMLAIAAVVTSLLLLWDGWRE